MRLRRVELATNQYDAYLEVITAALGQHPKGPEGDKVALNEAREVMGYSSQGSRRQEPTIDVTDVRDAGGHA